MRVYIHKCIYISLSIYIYIYIMNMEYGHCPYQDPANRDPLSLNSESAALRIRRCTKKKHPLRFRSSLTLTQI